MALKKITGNEPINSLGQGADGTQFRYKDIKDDNILIGLTIRQHFAATAMQGMLANSIDCQQGVEPWWHMHPKTVAAEAVSYADCLIAELNKESEVSNG